MHLLNTPGSSQTMVIFQNEGELSSTISLETHLQYFIQSTHNSFLPALIKAPSFLLLWQSDNDAECPSPWHLCHFKWTQPRAWCPGDLSLFRPGCKRSDLLSTYCEVSAPQFPESVCRAQLTLKCHFHTHSLFCQFTWPKSAFNCLLD